MALIHTASGQRSIDDGQIRHVILGGSLGGRWAEVTLVLRDRDVSGLMLSEAVMKLKAKLDAKAA